MSIDGKDPSDEFMGRFADQKPRIGKASRAHFKQGWVRDRSTGEKVVVLWVRSVRWISEDRAEVHGGSYCGGRCADYGTYRVIKKDDSWVVEEYMILTQA
jgi:hypothetical protein